ALWRLDRLSCCHALLASERLSPSARERVRLANWVTGVTFSPDGRRLTSSSDDGTVKIRDTTRLSGLHPGEQLRRGEFGLTDRDSEAARASAPEGCTVSSAIPSRIIIGQELSRVGRPAA